ncbi:MAG: hypothetical protein LQ347_002767 [Umbilicaria vellea]|nr:MAG: hypothetical protein LQ347_002767 [Umbilicaria vellea]
MAKTLELPLSYASLPYQHIRISHYPASSPTPTPVVVLTLYRPEKYNAFTALMAQELEEAFTLFSADDRVRCIVLTGHGKMFCAGADLQGELRGGDESASTHRDTGGRVTLAIHRCRKPTIAAVNGSAVGIGATMQLPCAIRIAYAQAKIVFVFARRGLVMEAASSFFLPRLIGFSRALHLTTTGATYRADAKLLDGLYSEILETPEAVMRRALEIAEEVASQTSVVATYLMREMMWRNPGSAEGAHLLDSRIIYDLFSSADKKEGVEAFLNKRAVNFTGTMTENPPSYYPWWEPVEVGGTPVPLVVLPAKKASKL